MTACEHQVSDIASLERLAITSAARSALVPSVPTLAESGLSGFDVYEWIIFLAPAKTPTETLSRLSYEVTKLSRSLRCVSGSRRQVLSPTLRRPRK